jgi:hypothetical protein
MLAYEHPIHRNCLHGWVGDEIQVDWFEYYKARQGVAHRTSVMFPFFCTTSLLVSVAVNE